MTHTELAARLGIEAESVNKLIEGSESLNEKTAVQLELILGIPRDFWLERERIY